MTTINLEQVDHLMQVENLNNLNKRTAARYAQYIKPGQTMLAHNKSCTILRRISKLPNGSIEVGLLRASALGHTVSSLLEMAISESGAAREKYLALAQKFIRANATRLQRRR